MITLLAPLDGWVLPLADVPDPVFSQGLAGAGVAIDPVSDVLLAPCDGRVALPAGNPHALVLHAADGIDLLLHVGIDTVALKGAGFTRLVADGEHVRAGTPLLRFDLDRVARGAASAVTPIVVAGGGRVLRTASSSRVRAGEFLMDVEAIAGASAGDQGNAADVVVTREVDVPFAHGLHARPAAQLAAALRPFAADVRVRLGAREASARSTVALLGLGVARGDRLTLVARGEDAAAALDAAMRVFGADAGTHPNVQHRHDAHDASGASADAIAPDAPLPTELPAVVASRGLATGIATYLDTGMDAAAAPPDVGGHDPVAERARLAAAIDAVVAHLERLAASQSGDRREILHAHIELVRDPGLHALAHEHLAAGRAGHHAWRAAIAAAIADLERLDDVHLRGRIADVRDVGQQVLAVLAGRSLDAAQTLPEDAIVLADELLPSQLLALDPRRLAGLCMVRGGASSHVAIIAAALGLPALVAVGPQLLRIPAGRRLVLDGERGLLHTAPDAAQVARTRLARDARARRAAADLAAADAPATTRDGVTVSVSANLGGLDEAAPAVARGADGCGLLRTEFLFLQRREAPDEDEQAGVYAAIVAALAPRQVAIRTMDVGGDKPIPYLPIPPEDNPALGLRGIRASLARPDLLRSQLRAILRVDAPGRVRILLPMVNEPGELRRVRALLVRCAAELGVGALPALGVMIETPAAALLAGELLAIADFASIGSNDLSQYTLAMDRGHPQLAAQLDALHPAVLRLIAHVAEAGSARGRPVGLCGGLASEPAAIPLLVGLGLRDLSAVPAGIPEIKRIVRNLDAQACADLAARALALEDAPAVRRLLAEAFPESTP